MSFSISMSFYAFGMAFVQCLFSNKIIWNVVSVFLWNLNVDSFSLSLKAQWLCNKVVSLFVLRLFYFFVCILFFVDLLISVEIRCV